MYGFAESCCIIFATTALGFYEEYMIDISVSTTLGSITIPVKQQKTLKTTAYGVKHNDIPGNLVGKYVKAASKKIQGIQGAANMLNDASQKDML